MTIVPPNIESVQLFPSIGDFCEIAFRRSACCHGLDPKATLIEFTFTVKEADMFVNGMLMPPECRDCINIIPVNSCKTGEIFYWILQRQDQGYRVTAYKHDQFNDLLLKSKELRFHFNLDCSTAFPRM